MWRSVRVLAAAAAFAWLAASAHAQAQAPRIHEGRLANGLRYAIVSAPTPKGAVSVRLGVDVGSYDEADDERGLAHFVEHMAFNGTKNFAEDALTGRFARMGVGFGRDQNAYTTETTTTFHLDLPNAQPASLDAAFQWLRDVADGMLFEPGAVDRERGVILSEREARSDADDAWRDAIQSFTYRGLRSDQRDPAGQVEIVSHAAPAKLKAFYDHWYRPENAVVVVVGDLPVEALEARVKAAFGDWTGRGQPGVRAPRLGPQGARGQDLFVKVDSHAPYAASACRVRGPDPTGAANARHELLADLWASALEERLKRLTTLPQAALQDTRVYGEGSPDAEIECVSVGAAKGRMEEALSQVGAEVRRFEREGPTDAEFEAAIEEMRAGMRGGIQDDATQAAPDRADSLMYDMLEEKPLVRGRQAMADFDRAVADLTPQDLLAVFRADWSGWGPIIRVTTPQPLADEAPLRTAWTTAPKTAAPVATAELEWPYKSFGKSGRVVKRETVAEPGFTRLTFSNGVVLNFKQTAFESGKTLIKVRFGAGRSEIPAGDYQLALLGATYFKDGGLGRMSLADLQSLTRGAAWDVDLQIDDRAFEMSGEAYTSGLESQLHILAAYLSDPGFRPSLDDVIPNNVEAAFRKLRSDPSDVMGQALTEAVTPGAPINRLPLDRAAALKSADFARVLKPAITTAPLQVTIVGDVSEADAIEAMSRTLAALPPRRAPHPVRPDTWFLRFPAEAPKTVRVTHDGARDKAIVGLFWPLFVAGPQTRHEEYALLMLGSILENRLVDEVRERLGKSYAPEAAAYLRDGGDQGYMWASVESTPADLPSVEAAAKAVVARIAAGEIGDTDLETARRPLLAHMDSDRAHNAWWLETLNAADRPAELDEYLHARALTAAVTVDDVKRAAAAWLKGQPIAVEVTPAAAAVKEAAR